MNPDIFAEWFRKQGQPVIRTTSSYWVHQGFGAYQAFPYHWLIKPDKKELHDILKESRALALRYSTPLQGGAGFASYHAVFEGDEYDLSSLGKWARKNVRRGLATCQVQPISFERLAEEGYQLQIDTLDRQGRKSGLEHSKWKTLCLSAGELPGFEAWGALVNGKLAASVITFRMDDCYYMLYQQCLRQYLSENVNNAMSYVVTNNLVKRPESKSILYGMHSLDAPPSVDEFKFRMGYAAKPVRQQVVFHPWFEPFANRLSHALLRGFLRLNPGNPTISKAEGMFRFYLEGNLPLEEQNWPEILSEYKQKYTTPHTPT